MALELNIFLLILGGATLLYLSGVVFRVPHLFLFGCVLLFGSGAILWGSGGLITSRYYDVEGVLQSNVLSMSDVGLIMFSLVLVAIPIISYLVLDFNPVQSRRVSPFHY